MGRLLRRIALCALVCVAMLPLSSCKDSDVLTQLIQDQNLGEIDYSADPIYEDVDNAQAGTDHTRVEGDIDNEDQQEATLATYDEDPNTDQTTDQTTQLKDTSHDFNATQGSEASDGLGSTTSTATGTDDDSGSEEADSNTQIPDNNQQESNPTKSGPDGTGIVYNDGTYTTLPTGTRTIAAVGQYALIVQMLAGKGALVAADDTWLSSVRATDAFSDTDDQEGLDAVATAWSGDGTAAGSVDIDALIAADPDVVLVGSNTSTLTQDECDQCTAAGIDVVVMPSLGDTDTEDDDIITAVQVVGQLLKGASTQYDSSTMASKYVTQHDEALSNVLNANGGYTLSLLSDGNVVPYLFKRGDPTTSYVSSNRYFTAFIDEWAHYNQSSVTTDEGTVVDISDGVGLSQMVGTANDNSLSQYYLQYAGVEDMASGGLAPGYSGRFRVSSDISSSDSSDLQIIDRDADDGGTPTSVYTFAGLTSSLEKQGVLIGSSDYPALIAQDEAIASSIVSSAGKVNGLYNMGQSYQVWVMPSGLAGSWADGNVESFLSAPWAYCMFQSGEDLTVCSSYVDTFYSTFYRCGAAGIVQDYGTSGIYTTQ